MIKYSDQPYTCTAISTSEEIEDSISTPSEENKLSLIQLWEYIIKTKNLPDGLDLQLVFEAIHERLKNPEWEVRQHALRVLVDLIPLIPNHTLDLIVDPVLGDLVTNLGHLGPAVRKGAVDSLRAYLNCTLYPDKVITDLVENGIEKCQENKFSTNVVLGIILSLPFLINNKLSESTLTYTIHTLLDKLVKIIHQETVLRSLLRVREIIGHLAFNRCLDSYNGYKSRKDFELLCEVYNLNSEYKVFSSRSVPTNNKSINSSNRVDLDLDDSNVNLNDTNVILETEIQLESGPAITMKIHEETGQKQKFFGVSKNDPFKVLPDEIDFYEFRRRTPRRVRFGGEIIKLRTPDSDSNHQSDDNDATLSIYSDNSSTKPIIEIKYAENKVKISNSKRSQIPVPIKQTQSAPNSPKKPSLAKSKIYKSSPNLSKSKKATSIRQGKSRIPRRSSTNKKNKVETKIEIKIGKKSEIIPNNTKELKREIKPSTWFNSDDQCNNGSSVSENIEVKNALKSQPTKSYIVARRNSREDEFSPVPIHNEIEVLHNLTRSPSPFNKPKTETKFPDINLKNSDSLEVNLNNIGTDLKNDFKNVPHPIVSTSGSKKKDHGYCSFQLCESSFYEFEDSPIPTKDSGDCLTCSSSGSDSVVVDKRSYGQFEFLDLNVIKDLNNVNDMNARVRGLESLKRFLEKPEVLSNVQDKLSPLLHLLFTLEQQPLLQPLAEQTLTLIFTNMDTQCLTAKLHQILLFLSKAGSPLGVRLAILLMKRISPKIVVDTLLSDSIVGAKSSKVREGALQIIMSVSRIFPSTDVNIPKAVSMILPLVKDRKRKVRKVALETLATLAQLSSNGFVLETANEIFNDWRDKEQILKVIRTRLSRKQLSVVNLNGNIRYSSPTSQSEIDWLHHGCEMGQPSKINIRSLSARNLEDIENNNNFTTNNMLKFESSSKTFRRRLLSAQTENVLSSSFSQEIERFITSSPERFVQDLGIEKRRFLSGGYIESIDNQTNFNSSEESKTIDIGCENTTKHSNSLIFDNFNHLPDINNGNLQTKQDSQQSNVVKVEKTSANEYPLLSDSSFEQNDANENDKDKNILYDVISEQKVNYWKINSRKFEENKFQLDDNEDSNGNTPKTQIWAIEPSALSSSQKLSTSNGTLKEVFMVKPNGTPIRYRDGGTNTTPILSRTNRGRSFSPPLNNGQSHYDSYDEKEPPRFINNLHKEKKYNERIRRSFSTEFLSPLERFRKDSTASSECSSGSSIRQNASRHRDLHSGIPVSTNSGSKFRIRSKNVKRRREPLSIPYYHSVKSPSPLSTPEKSSPCSVEKVINRQPFSSGSESSGYFTPPPDTNNQEDTPEVLPRLKTIVPETSRFIKIETPKNSVENLIISDSESETCDNEQNIVENIEIIENVDVNINGTKFERINTSSSLNESILHETKVFKSEILPERETYKSETALDEIDFTKITYSGKHAISKSEVDIQISTQISRKNINSAPATADFDDFNEISIVETTCLPGSVDDSIENTEAPEELFGCSPTKKSPSKTHKQSLRRKSTRILTVSTPMLSDKPFPKPKEAFHDIVERLESSEWEETMKGIKGLVNLLRFHKELVENNMHTICVLLGKHIKNLRSQVARASCLAASELFNMSKRPLEMELDELAAPLLHRTADTNKFLRSDANNALDEMTVNLSVPKVISVITYRGSTHQNAVVRCASARLLCNIVHRLGPEKIFQLPRDTRDKIIITGATMLTEGSLETRRHAKLLLGHLSSHSQFQRSISETVPPNLLRLIDKTLRSIIN